MFHKLYLIIKDTVDSVVDYCYNGNFNAFRNDPIIGNILAIGFMSFVDKHIWSIVHFIGTMSTLCITLALGTFLPAIYRYYAHKLGERYPIVKEILKHDKKNRDDR